MYENDQKGMIIHVNFDVNNMLGIEGSCNVWFYFEDGTELKDNNNSYRTSNGTVCASTKIAPGYKKSVYEDLRIFIPYSELHMGKGSSELKAQVGIFEYSDPNNHKQIALSEYLHFIFN